MMIDGDVLDKGAANDAFNLTLCEHSPFRLPSDWDAFGERCGCSPTALAGWIATSVLTSRGMRSARSYEIFIETRAQKTKLAQATVMKSKGQYLFLHQLAVAPEFDELWLVAMQGLLNRVGAGRYAYNPVLNGVVCAEKSRFVDLEKIRGVKIESVRPVVQQSVRFQNWRSWDDYYSGISTNAKRNYKRAQKEIENLNIMTRRGLAALTEAIFLAKCKRKALRQKGVNFFTLRFLIRFTLRCIFIGDRQFVSVVLSGGKRLSAISGLEYGAILHYVDGGRSDDRNGAAWYLMIETLRKFYERCPHGVFELGYFDETTHTEAGGGGLARFRRACQATDLPADVIRFRFDPADL